MSEPEPDTVQAPATQNPATPLKSPGWLGVKQTFNMAAATSALTTGGESSDAGEKSPETKQSIFAKAFAAGENDPFGAMMAHARKRKPTKPVDPEKKARSRGRKRRRVDSPGMAA